MDGVGPNIDSLSENVELGGCGELQSAVGDCAPEVAAGNEVLGGIGGPAAVPEHGQDFSITKRDKVDTSQAEARGITCAVSGRGCVRDNLSYLCWARARIIDEPGKILQ